MNILQKITLPFTIIGAFNWGLVALFNFNLVEWNTVRFWHSHGMLATLRKIKRKLLFQTETQGNGNEQ